MTKTCHQNALHKNYKKAGALLLLYFTNSCSRIIGLDYKPTCTFADADECFKDTNLLILGSSTSRHWFFALREVLQETGNRIGINGIDGRTDFVTVLSPRNRYAKNYRESEKKACGGGKLLWSEVDQVKSSLPGLKNGARCSALINRTHTLLTFVWHIPFRLGMGGAAALWDASPVLLSDAKANQMRVSRVLINGGLELSINFNDTHYSWLKVMNKTLSNITEPWKRILESRPPGSTKSTATSNTSKTANTVTWRTASSVCCEKQTRGPPSTAPCVNRDGVDLEVVRGRLRKVNEEAVKQLRIREPRISILDSWNTTGYDTCSAYEDWVHAPSLAFLQLESWMRDILGCSCTGIPRTDPMPWKSSDSEIEKQGEVSRDGSSHKESTLAGQRGRGNATFINDFRAALHTSESAYHAVMWAVAGMFVLLCVGRLCSLRCQSSHIATRYPKR